MKKRSIIIIKVGTNTITGKNHQLDKDYVRDLVAQISSISGEKEVALVSSGSIQMGLTKLGMVNTSTLSENQAAAAVGQGLLIHHFQQLFQKHNRISAQVLLTNDGLHNRDRYLNARNTIFTLFDKKVIPIINENDTVATEEIRFGDNDNLAAQVAVMLGAERLIYLSDVDGFYEDGETKKIIPVIEVITPEIEKAALGPDKYGSKGGMTTKIQGAKMALQNGCHVHIANGRQAHIIRDIVSGRSHGTHFIPRITRKNSRKMWIGVSRRINGQIIVDEGAERALCKDRSSLLPVGIVGVSGEFKLGDVVSVINEHGTRIGRGLVNYNAEEMGRIKGIRSPLIPQILGYQGNPEVIHRDNLLVHEPITQTENSSENVNRVKED